MMTEVVLGIDIGTSGVRVAAVGRDLRVLAMASVPLAAPVQNDGHATQDPELWWQATDAALRALDCSGLSIVALAIDGTSGTIVAVDCDGKPLGSGSMYNDVADAELVSKVAAVARRETAALGGTSPLARALRLRAGAFQILHQADWVVGRMTGFFGMTDENNALKTGYDPVTRSWPNWIAATGLDPSLLPKVVAAGTRIGTILPAIADRFGLPQGTAVVAGTTDGCAAFLASGAAQPGDGVTSLGTTLTIKLLSDRPVFAPEYGIYSHRIGNQWLAGGASNSGGAVLAGLFSRDRMAELEARLEPEHPTGLDYYPLPKPGERFPMNDPTMQPRMTPRPEDDVVFFQAILEGIAGVEALGYRRLAELGASPLTSIRSVGGGAANAAWTRMRQRVLQVPEKRALSDHAAVGTARLAWRGVGHDV